MRKIMTAEESFNLAMNEYPTLYVSPTLELAKLKHFDHLFNVIGNGYRDMDEFIDGMTINNKNKDKIETFPEKYITSEPIYEVYTEIDNKSKYSQIGKRGTNLPELYTKEEIKNMTNIKYKSQVNENFKTIKESFNVFVPYPNFKKEHSILWSDLKLLDDSWLEAGLFFYNKCKEFFNSKNTNFYHNAHPKENDTKAWDKLINMYEEGFSKYKKVGLSEEKINKEISEAYELEYNGDTKQFIKNRWSKELLRINEFIELTLERLITELDLRNNNKNNKSEVWTLIEDYVKNLESVDYWSGNVKSSVILNSAYEARNKVTDFLSFMKEDSKKEVMQLIEDYAKNLKEVDYWSGNVKSSFILNKAYESKNKLENSLNQALIEERERKRKVLTESFNRGVQTLDEATKNAQNMIESLEKEGLLKKAPIKKSF